MKVKIKITEKLVRYVKIEADSVDEAKQKADDMYRAGDIILTADDFTGYTITRA